MLYIFAGLPAVGKSTLAQRLARRLRAVYVRIDTIEDALRKAEAALDGPEGYVAAYGVVADNLKLGHTVIADCVNPVAATRRAWRAVASESAAACVELEIVCSDEREHRLRVESRPTAQLDWTHVLERSYEPWETPRIVLDTAGKTVDETYAALLRLLKLDAPPVSIEPSSGAGYLQLDFGEITAAGVSSFVQLFVDAFTGPPWDVTWSRDAAAERLMSFSSFPRFRGLGVRAGNEPAGVVLGWGERWSSGWVFHIKEMCVAPAFHNRGVGKALLERFEQLLGAEGYQSIYLETSLNDASRAFYEKRDYRPLELVSLKKGIADTSSAARSGMRTREFVDDEHA